MNVKLEIDPEFDDAGWERLLRLIQNAFAYMDGRIDPPSSATRLNPDSLKRKAQAETLIVAYWESELVGCMFCRVNRDTNRLYVGKVAVAPELQQRGIGRALFAKAYELSRGKGLHGLELETRIELTGNRQAFEKLGFSKTAESVHPGYGRPTSITMYSTKPLQ